MARPLYYDGSNLREMTDAQLERIVYYTQQAWANQINTSGNVGEVFVGTSGTGSVAIGSQTDTLSAVDVNQRAAPSNDGTNQSYPAYPGLDTTTGTTYSYRQYTNAGSWISELTANTYGYLCLDGSYDIKVVRAEADVQAEVITQVLNEIKSGNLVGSYRVASSTPNLGGAGTWYDKGTWFIDTRYNDVGNTTYKLYLKQALSTVPGEDIFPLRLFGTDMKPDNLPYISMVQNIFRPALERKILSGTHLCYQVSGTAGSDVRGTIEDTKYNQEVRPDRFTTGSGSSEIYYSRSTPLTTGTTTTVTTRYLNYLG